MKKILSIVFVLVFALTISSCNNKATEEHSGVHTHEDGTVHNDGDHEDQVKPEQESFEVEADSTEAHDHDHDHDHDHQH